MSSAPTTRPAPTQAPRSPQPQPPSHSRPHVVPLDPVKLAKKYMWLLIIAAILGMAIGIGATFVLKRTTPVWTSKTIFEVHAPQAKIGTPEGTEGGNEKELNRFMQTQVQFMESPIVLERVATDPRLAQEAPQFAAKVSSSGRVDPAMALQALEGLISARVLRGTTLMELSAKAADPNEATALVRLVRESYESFLRQQTGLASSKQKDALQRSISTLENEIKRSQSRRERILEEEDIDSLDERYNESTRQLGLVQSQLVSLRMDIEAFTTQLDGYLKELESPGGPTYSDQLRESIQADPAIRNLNQQITSLENALTSMKLQGIKPAHRDWKAIEAQIEATKHTLGIKTEERLRSAFDATVDGTRKAIAQLRAQEADLLTQKEEASARMAELTKISADVQDLEQEIGRMIDTVTKRKEELDNLNALGSLLGANRVTIAQPERRPDSMTFPKLKILAPAGMILLTGLVAGLVLLREILDQRVKGPADVAVIPRTRVLGMVPLASEDPSNPKAVETIFRDDPKGVLAEHFRTLRSSVIKAMQRNNHKTLLVMAGMPKSGATTVVANLGMAVAAADRRVLVVDANFRRPALHKIFGLGESPGLADVLAGEVPLDDAIRPSGIDGLDVLCAGSAEHRVVERLSGRLMHSEGARIKEKYDIVLIDAPPAIVSGDGLSLASFCDASMLVIRALNEKRGMVARIKNDLTDTRSEMLGVLVNGVRSSVGGYLRKNIRASHEYQIGYEQRAEKKSRKSRKNGADDGYTPDSNA